MHGFFDAPGVARAAAEALAAGKGTALRQKGAAQGQKCTAPGQKGAAPVESGRAAGSRDALQNRGPDPGGREYKETQYDLLAQTLRAHLDLQRIYEIMGVPAQGNS